MMITKSAIRLHATPKAVITRYLEFNGTSRIQNVISRIAALTDEEATDIMNNLMIEFNGRHRDIHHIFQDHFNKINELKLPGNEQFSETKQSLLGAMFTMEYSIQSAALFNPSIVQHPDQGNLQPGEQRFIMSLRATGEGHISSIVFKTGVVDKEGKITLNEAPDFFTRLAKHTAYHYKKSFLKTCAQRKPGFNEAVLDFFPPTFTAAFIDTIAAIKSEEDVSIIASIATLQQVVDTNYELLSSAHLPMNGKVIFPNAKSECMGMEDVRFVKFEDEGKICYYGTYTAYNGHQIKTQLLETTNFDVFKIRTLYGAAVSDKGMALFPEKVNGQYVMISRQGGEMINIMFSDDLYYWQNYQQLMQPAYPWEMLQLGNCGSPVKTDKGWLLLTHGVGLMRTYVISAILLDLQDPTKIIGRLTRPLIKADETEREGYVPNVVYTCGLLQHSKLLLIPYAVSDSATGFVTVDTDEILNEMK